MDIETLTHRYGDLEADMRVIASAPSPSDARAIRLAAGMTLSELAVRLEVDRTTLSRWESERTHPIRKNLIRWALAIGAIHRGMR